MDDKGKQKHRHTYTHEPVSGFWAKLANLRIITNDSNHIHTHPNQSLHVEREKLANLRINNSNNHHTHTNTNIGRIACLVRNIREGGGGQGKVIRLRATESINTGHTPPYHQGL